jgi:hypothetical protein
VVKLMTGKARKTGKVVDSEGIRGKRERRKDGKEKARPRFRAFAPRSPYGRVVLAGLNVNFV